MSNRANGEETVLRARLAAIGVLVPDQLKARVMLERSRLGFKPEQQVGRLRRIMREYGLRRLGRLLRAVIHQDIRWLSYKLVSFPPRRHDFECESWGGRMPDEAMRTRRLIEEKLPDVEHCVLASFWDPAYVVDPNGERLILHLWVRDSTYSPVRLVF